MNELHFLFQSGVGVGDQD